MRFCVRASPPSGMPFRNSALIHMRCTPAVSRPPASLQRYHTLNMPRSCGQGLQAHGSCHVRETSVLGPQTAAPHQAGQKRLQLSSHDHRWLACLALVSRRRQQWVRADPAGWTPRPRGAGLGLGRGRGWKRMLTGSLSGTQRDSLAPEAASEHGGSTYMMPQGDWNRTRPAYGVWAYSTPIRLMREFSPQMEQHGRLNIKQTVKDTHTTFAVCSHSKCTAKYPMATTKRINAAPLITSWWGK
jgi:hypothetical protein